MIPDWLTADHHFGHHNIIRYCRRPFLTTSEMEQELVRRWNTLVRPNDVVWHLGDFAWWHLPASEVVRIRQRLNGDIYLVLGNHDLDKDTKQITEGVRQAFGTERIVEYARLRLSEKVVLGLYHWGPQHVEHPPWTDPVDLWVHGHSHQHPEVGTGTLNVSVERTSYAPLSLAEVLAKVGLER